MGKRNIVWCTVFIVLFSMGNNGACAQDLKSILSGVAKAVGDKVNEKTASLEGTWVYAAPDCKFESDNLLAKAGGEAAAKKVEDEMEGVLSKLGFKEGTTYTFNADSTYTSVIGGCTSKGTYSYNTETKELPLKDSFGTEDYYDCSKRYNW